MGNGYDADIGDSQLVLTGDDQAELEARLSVARVDLAEAEAVWAELFGALSELQARYWVEVGPLVAAVAEARAELEQREFAARASESVDEEPPPQEGPRAEEAREVEDEFKAWATSQPEQESAPQPATEDQRRELRKLIVEAARRFHPDLADDANDLEERNRLMSEANRLYAARDADGLRRLLETAHVPSKTRSGSRREQLLDELHETWRERDRLGELADSLRTSTWASLRARCDELAEQGIDPWEHLRVELTHELDELRAQISALA